MIERLDTPAEATPGGPDEEQGDDGEEDLAAGPISIAVDLNEAEPDAAPAPDAAAVAS